MTPFSMVSIAKPTTVGVPFQMTYAQRRPRPRTEKKNSEKFWHRYRIEGERVSSSSLLTRRPVTARCSRTAVGHPERLNGQHAIADPLTLPYQLSGSIHRREKSPKRKPTSTGLLLPRCPGGGKSRAKEAKRTLPQRHIECYSEWGCGVSFALIPSLQE